MFGIKNWEVNRYNVTKEREDISRVTLEGSYIDPKERRIYFLEYHYYSSKKMLQILLTHESKSELNKDSGLSKVRKFKKQYGF